MQMNFPDGYGKVAENQECRQARQEADRQGVAGYLTKPFSPADLRASVDAFAGVAA